MAEKFSVSVDEVKATLDELTKVFYFDEDLGDNCYFNDWFKAIAADKEDENRQLNSSDFWRTHYLDGVEKNLPPYIKIRKGITRAVILDDNHPAYVLKFQYCDFYYDFNRAEKFVYDRACDNGLDFFFAPTIKVLTYNGVDVYAQMRCDVDYDRMNDASSGYLFEEWCEGYGAHFDEEERTDKFYEEWDEELGGQEAMLHYARSFWGKDAVNDLEDFLNFLEVNDCHCGNWGYHNDTLLLTDYAGYNQRDKYSN